MNRENPPTERRQAQPLAAENFEPYEEPRRIPLPVYWIAIALGLWGLVTLYRSSQAVQIGRPEQVTGFSGHKTNSGATLFEARCATCHQANGSGIAEAVPPLDGSPFVTTQPDVIVQILLHGLQGAIEVNGSIYNGNMPDFSSVLSDEDIARLTSFVRGAWSNRAGAVTPEFVADQRQRFASQAGFWKGGAELLAAVNASDIPPQPPVAAPAPATAEPDILDIVLRDRSEGPWACASCHGAAGQGSLNIPRLAGLNEAYILKQLRDYVGGTRRNETMQLVAGALSLDEMQGLARYYESLPTRSAAQPSLGGDVARGERLALHGDWSKNIPACFSCHGSSGFGVGAQFPAVAAQHSAYTVAQLNAWIGGTRNNSQQGMMESISTRLSENDRKAVADYFATLPPVPIRFTSQKGD